MKGYLIDSKTDECYVADIEEPSLDEYYRLLGCDCIDIVMRNVRGHLLNIVVDDIGLY